MTRGVVDVEVSSELAASPAEVWAVAATMAGVNDELGPWIRMTHPPDAHSLHDERPADEPLAFDSWVLIAGVVPFDRHHLNLERVIDPHDQVGAFGFDEESTTWLQRRWRHERRIVATPAGCRVTDHLIVVPRLRALAPIVRSVVPIVFEHRHRRLARRFGAIGGGGRS